MRVARRAIGCDAGAISPAPRLTRCVAAAAHHRLMNDRDRQPGPDKSPSGPREANDPGSTRYGTNPGSGSNEPKHRERKETDRGFEPRQGGDQTRTQPSRKGERDGR
ncbi:MAG: hypothetical protein K0S97_1318 [Chloroflexota bacterium]|nr:hypothetical protein [Chloroflexota bacterium]